MKKILDLYKKYEEIVNYLIVGVATTVFSWAVRLLFAYTIFDVQIAWQNTVVNVIGWVFGVIFAYFTNRRYVFKSTQPDMLKEFLDFSAGRLGTLLLDVVCMYLMVNRLGMNYALSMILVSVLVMIGNYVLSKFFVFGKL
jgi:putative flippase GtrA